MTKFIRNGNTITVHADGAMDISDKLPPGNYSVRADGTGSLFLEKVKDFTLPSKTYGDIERVSERIRSTFASRSNNTGVLLVGEKGSGKTLLAKHICLSIADAGVPTILVNQPFKCESLNSLIAKIDQPCVIFFDEFEKTYPDDDDEHSQEGLLTLLDGVYNTKKLFLLTCNDENSIDQHMINRPGRIFYLKKFTGLDSDFIEEYINDELKSDRKDYGAFKNELCYYVRLMGTVNFDMLKAIVEEANRYDCSVDEIFGMLNVGNTDKSCYEAFLTIYGEEIEEIELPSIRDPLGSVKGFSFCLSDCYNPEIRDIITKRTKNKLPVRFYFKPTDMTNVDKNGTMYFKNEDGHKIMLKKVISSYGGYRSAKYRG